MRIILTQTKQGVQVSYLELEHKYLVKFEIGPQEITLKFKKGPGLESVEDLKKLEEDHLFDAVEKQLSAVSKIRMEAWQSFSNDKFDFEEII